MRIIITFILYLGLVGMVACSQGPGAKTTEEVQRQMIQYQQVKRHGRLFYVGIATGANLDQTTEQAYLEISRQLTWLPAGDVALRKQLHGLYRVDRTATDRTGTIHVLAVLEREAASSMLRKLASEHQQVLRERLNHCKKHLEAGDMEKARDLLQKGKHIAQKIRELLTASHAAVGDQVRKPSFVEEGQLSNLEAKIVTSDTRRRTVLVHVLSYIDGRVSGEMNADFRQVASSKGFKVTGGTTTEKQVANALAGMTKAVVDIGKNAGAGYIVVGKVTARFSSEDNGQYFAWASGRLRMIETTSGRSIAEITFDKIKGGHISRSQACERAIQNVVTKLKSELRKRLGEL